MLVDASAAVVVVVMLGATRSALTAPKPRGFDEVCSRHATGQRALAAVARARPPAKGLGPLRTMLLHGACDGLQLSSKRSGFKLFKFEVRTHDQLQSSKRCQRAISFLQEGTS